MRNFFSFLKPVQTKTQAPQTAASAPNELIFKSGKDAIEYVKQYMRTEWEPDSVAVALIAHPVFEKGVLSARVLIPKDDGFVELPTFTAITAVNSREQGRIPVDETSDISVLGLNFGDLVTVILAGRDAQLVDLLPGSDGWIAFIIGKNLPVYSLRDRGWIMEKKYEL
jgi:hypothetical protein